MALIDWAAVIAYVVFAIGVGLWYARRAGKDVDEFFLSGRTLPWWITGTSMIATSFASDTPLVVSGWVRDYGIWKNWLWWCYAVSGMFMVFLFARYWRAGRIMTKAELVELRYPDGGAAGLRGALGFLHALVINPWILCWVLLAASKIMGGLFDVDKLFGLSVACGLAMTYSLLAGFWGVVVTDLLQFVMAMVGAIALAVIAWQAVGGGDAVHAAVDAGTIDPDVVAMVPDVGADGISAAFAAFLVYMGVAWWAVKNSDGGAIAVQRIAASKDERHGMLASLWFHVGHYALRPWAWIAVGVASLLVLPSLELTAPADGVVSGVDGGRVVMRAADGTTHALEAEGASD
ncbi:MAG: sodium:proline symporter, partial [Planctomycetota bacterium]|nr:sodium:proline symporter [Planctomycetota bacterium]